MGYLIQLEVYEGPFDLLLDLIARNEIDVWDIPVATITNQYLEYLFSLQERDLAITGEFLVMAATLIRIKSRLLLPEEPEEKEKDEKEERDPRQELVQQLLRYKFFKDAASFLQEKYQASSGFYPRGREVIELNRVAIFTNPLGNLTLPELTDIYRSLFLESLKEPEVHAVTPGISVQERLGLVRLQMMGQSKISFSELILDYGSLEVVVTFLAVLELARLGEITIVQKESFGEINIEPGALGLEVYL